MRTQRHNDDNIPHHQPPLSCWSRGETVEDIHAELLGTSASTGRTVFRCLRKTYQFLYIHFTYIWAGGLKSCRNKYWTNTYDPLLLPAMCPYCELIFTQLVDVLVRSHVETWLQCWLLQQAFVATQQCNIYYTLFLHMQPHLLQLGGHESASFIDAFVVL